VDTDDGPVVLCGDAAMTRGNYYDLQVPAPAYTLNSIQALDCIRFQLKQIEGIIPVFSHDLPGKDGDTGV
jgi:hypothetical protein